MSKRLAFLLPLLLIFGCSGDDSTSSPTEMNTVTVEVHDSFFQPRSVRVNPGTTVRWVLQGSMTNHTTTENNGLWDSGFVFPGTGRQLPTYFYVGR
jgi:plastocyanin